MTDINLALMPTGSNIVENIIVGDASFTLTGYTILQIKSGVLCEIGMYYNSSDGLFYQDAAFTSIYVIYDNATGEVVSATTATDTATTATTDSTTTTS